MNWREEAEARAAAQMRTNGAEIRAKGEAADPAMNAFEQLKRSELRPDTPVHCCDCGRTITHERQHCITWHSPDGDVDEVLCDSCMDVLDREAE